MIKETIAIGKDILEAKDNARAALGVGELDDVEFEVLHYGSKGFMGFFTKPAKVRAYINLPERDNARQKDAKRERQKADRPREDRRPEEKKAAELKDAEAQAPAAQQDKPKKKKKKNKKPQQDAGRAESKAKSQVIPETELKMELKMVEEGEDMSFDFINTVIKDIGLDATAMLYSCEDGTRRITISGEDASTLIGHHGDTLDALQYLANLASARKNSKGERDKSRVTIDIEGYRAKREETLRALARRMAAKAKRNNRSVMLEPMSAYERRIIHSEVQLIDGVSTNSIGSDNNRKIVIYLTDKKPEGIFEDDSVAEDADASVACAPTQTATASDLDEAQAANETVAIINTMPDESEDIDTDLDSDDIK